MSKSQTPPVSGARLRVWAALVGIICTAVLVAAWHLSAGSLPFGPKSQLSLPGCAFRDKTGYPCPTCGMTTAWRQTVRGNLPEALEANFAGVILALACVVTTLGAFGTVGGGTSFYRRFVKPLTGLLSLKHWVYLGLGLIVLAWGWNALKVCME